MARSRKASTITDPARIPSDDEFLAAYLERQGNKAAPEHASTPPRPKRTIQIEAVTDAMIEVLKDELHLGRKDDVIRRGCAMLDLIESLRRQNRKLVSVPADFHDDRAHPVIVVG